MIIYIITICMIFTLGYVLLLKSTSLQNRKIFVFLTACIFIVLSGFRHVSIGEDTMAYQTFFQFISEESWGNLLSNFWSVLFLGEGERDPGYGISVKLFQVLCEEYQVYLIFIAIVFTGALSRFIYKNSAEPCLSYLLYLSLFFSFFGITGLRQTIATVFVNLLGYECIKKRKLILFMVLAAISAMIHLSSLVFLPFYFIANKTISKKYIVFTIVVALLSVMFNNLVYDFFASKTVYSFYGSSSDESDYGGVTWNFSIMLAITLIISIWRKREILRRNPNAVHYINACIIAFLFTPLSYINPSAMRIVQYFSIFLLLLVPEIIRSFSEKTLRILLYYIVTAMIIFLFLKKEPVYLFFWQ